ncbi:MAG: hypothetical protein ACOYIK_00975 [Coriobacteriales bacterium]|jgi:hypothetical protein
MRKERVRNRHGDVLWARRRRTSFYVLAAMTALIVVLSVQQAQSHDEEGAGFSEADHAADAVSEDAPVLYLDSENEADGAGILGDLDPAPVDLAELVDGAREIGSSKGNGVWGYVVDGEMNDVLYDVETAMSKNGWILDSSSYGFQKYSKTGTGYSLAILQYSLVPDGVSVTMQFR